MSVYISCVSTIGSGLVVDISDYIDYLQKKRSDAIVLSQAICRSSFHSPSHPLPPGGILIPICRFSITFFALSIPPSKKTAPMTALTARLTMRVLSSRKSSLISSLMLDHRLGIEGCARIQDAMVGCVQREVRSRMRFVIWDADAIQRSKVSITASSRRSSACKKAQTYPREHSIGNTAPPTPT